MRIPELEVNDIFEEVEKLELEIEEMKNNMDVYGQAFYQGFIENKNRMMKVVEDSYRVRSDIKELLKRF